MATLTRKLEDEYEYKAREYRRGGEGTWGAKRRAVADMIADLTTKIAQVLDCGPTLTVTGLNEMANMTAELTLLQQLQHEVA